MKKIINNGWEFAECRLHTGISGLDDAEFVRVHLPHDFLITDTTDLYRDATGWYRRKIDMDRPEWTLTGPGNDDEALSLRQVIEQGGHVFVNFDGVYMDSRIYVDGEQIAEWKYGYSPFTVELTDHLKSDRPELMVRIDHQSPNTRWYSGAGIYRDVTLIVKGSTFIPENGVYISPKKNEDGSYRLMIETEVSGMITNDAPEDKDTLEIIHELIYKGSYLRPADENVSMYSLCKDTGLTQAPFIQGGPFVRSVCSKTDSDESQDRTGSENAVYEQTAIRKYTETFRVEHPHIWDVSDPQLYMLRTMLYKDGSLTDTLDNTIGFRDFVADPERGFVINGRQMKLNGVCEHHDHGALGSAFSKEAMRRKLCRLRSMGVNALRLTHNMAAVKVLELADELGFVLISEGFDMWERPKTEYDYARFFPEWHERDVEAWIRRDRNHVSVAFWSIGNEIYDTHANDRGREVTVMLKELVEKHDHEKNARATIGSNYMPWEGARKCADVLKIAGYNYAERFYEEHHREHPDWVIYGSETSSIVQSRGIYHFPLNEPLLSEDDEQCSALGNSATSWSARNYEECVTMDRDMPFSMGQFLWTGFDYIGEPTPYQTKNSYFGQIDTAGIPKDSYYVWRAAWTDVDTHPMVHVFPYWDFNDGQIIDVRVCSNADVVELFVNGKSCGTQELDNRPGSGRHIIANYKVPFEKGNITARAYIREGDSLQQAAEETRHSFGDSSKLVIRTDWCSGGSWGHDGRVDIGTVSPVLRAGTDDLLYLEISAVDPEGYPVENACDRVKITVTGAGYLVGTDNGDSTDTDSYQSADRRMFSGKLMAIIAPSSTPGEICIRAESEGLVSAEIMAVCEEAGTEEVCSATSAQDGETAGTHPEDGYLYVRALSDEKLIRTGKICEKPVRRIDLKAPEGLAFDPGHKSLSVNAAIEPSDAGDKAIIWRAITDSGVDTNLVRFSADDRSCTLTALGDGSFRLRAMSKSGTDNIRVISELECEVKGLGPAFTDPYSFVSGSLVSRVIGEYGPGNERGIASARDGETIFVFDRLDFGPVGSDEITVPIFALSGDEYPIEFWEGVPGEDGAELIASVVYQKPSIWNTYQPDTWKLSKRLKGLTILSVRVWQKFHMKGFTFRKYLSGLEQNSVANLPVYGDSFVMEKDAVTGIGNNVSIECGELDFGEEGVTKLTICGRTPVQKNTLHAVLTNESAERREILEFMHSDDYTEQSFELSDTLSGKWKLTYVFLPGSNFDFKWYRFS